MAGHGAGCWLDTICKIESLTRVLCFEMGHRAKWNRSLAQFGSINRTWPNGKLTPHVKLMEYKDESMSKDSIQETSSFIWDCQHRKGKFHLEQRNSRHRETAARFSKRNGPGCVCSIWRDGFIGFPFPNPLFWNAFRKPTDVPMFFYKVKSIMSMQHGGFTRTPTASCGKWFHSLLSFGPKSAQKFAGVCYDGAEGDGVLCRLLQGNKRFYATFNDDQGSVSYFWTAKCSSRWFAMLQTGWKFTTLNWPHWWFVGKSFHTTIKHVTLKKMVFAANLWQDEDSSQKNTMQDLEVRDGQELLWTSRLGSFNSFLEMQVLGRWDIFSCKNLSSFATANVFMLQNKVIFLKTPTGLFKALNANRRYDISKRHRQDKRIPVVAKVLGIESGEPMTWTARKHPAQARGLIKKSSVSDLGPYEFMSYSVHLLLNSDFVCCFALFVLSIKKDWYVCITSPIVQRTSD